MKSKTENHEDLIKKLADFSVEENEHISNPFLLKNEKQKRIEIEIEKFVDSLEDNLERGFKAIEEELSISNPNAKNSLQLWLLINLPVASSLTIKELISSSEPIENEEHNPPPIFKRLGLSENLLSNMFEAANNLYHKNEYEKARHAFSILAQLNPEIECIWTAYGLSLQQSNLPDLALYAYAMSITLEEENPYPYYYSALCYQDLEITDEAKKLLEKAIHLCENQDSYEELKKECEKIRSDDGF